MQGTSHQETERDFNVSVINNNLVSITEFGQKSSLFTGLLDSTSTDACNIDWNLSSSTEEIIH